MAKADPFLGIGPYSQFIQENQRVGAGLPDDLIEMKEVAGEGAQILFYVLLIADDGKDLLKDPGMASLCHGNGKPALNHQGQESQGFQRHCLSARVRPADDQGFDSIRETEIDRDDLHLLLKGKKGMARLSQVNLSFVGQVG